MNKPKKTALAWLLAAPFLLLSSCDGGAEEVGEDIDQAADDVQDAAEDATDGE